MADANFVKPVIEASWLEILEKEFRAPYFAQLKSFLVEEKKNNLVFPPGSLIFNAFNLTPFPKVKVVLMGQDPYHNPGQAHGLCFSVPQGAPLPKSLINIFKELHDDIGCPVPQSGNLEKWAKQGVLLLNTILTVRAHQPSSHREQGWETFTDAVIREISSRKENVVFILWGAYAANKIPLIDTRRHHILQAAHPSPFSAHKGFYGCSHFSKTNQLLNQAELTEIDWTLA